MFWLTQLPSEYGPNPLVQSKGPTWPGSHLPRQCHLQPFSLSQCPEHTILNLFSGLSCITLCIFCPIKSSRIIGAASVLFTSLFPGTNKVSVLYSLCPVNMGKFMSQFINRNWRVLRNFTPNHSWAPVKHPCLHFSRSRKLCLPDFQTHFPGQCWELSDKSGHKGLPL